MTETEIQKLFAYQYGLLNNNLVLPNITMKGSEGGGYLLKLAVRADQYLYLGDYIEDSEQTFVNLGIRPWNLLSTTKQ